MQGGTICGVVWGILGNLMGSLGLIEEIAIRGAGEMKRRHLTPHFIL
jgi:hypothetical protein